MTDTFDLRVVVLVLGGATGGTLDTPPFTATFARFFARLASYTQVIHISDTASLKKRTINLPLSVSSSISSLSEPTTLIGLGLRSRSLSEIGMRFGGLYVPSSSSESSSSSMSLTVSFLLDPVAALLVVAGALRLSNGDLVKSGSVRTQTRTRV